MVVSGMTWGVLHAKEKARRGDVSCRYHISVFSLNGEPVESANVRLELHNFPWDKECNWLLYPDKVRAQRVNCSDVKWWLTFREQERDEMVRIFAYTEDGNSISRHLLAGAGSYPHVNLQCKYVFMPNYTDANVLLPYLSLGFNSESSSFSSMRYNAMEPVSISLAGYLRIGERETVNEHIGNFLKKYPRRRFPDIKVARTPTPENTDTGQGDDEWLIYRDGERLVVFGFGA